MSSPIARCPRCGHHSRFEGRAGSVVRCSCGADLVLSEVRRPPLGTRWGDISPEERAALPVGTRLRLPPDHGGIANIDHFDRVRLPTGRWFCALYGEPEGAVDADLNDGRTILSYPPEPDPRDSDGPVDEGGGEAKGGDNDCDGDVPEVARCQTRTGKKLLPGHDFAVARRPWGTWWQVLTAYKTLAGAHRGCPDGRHVVNYRAVPSCSVVRLYWPPTCEGAEDAPRDCLEAP